MRKFIEKIHSRFNLKNKSFYRAISALMAVAVVISVCSSLITPAISLTSAVATSLSTTAAATTSTDQYGNTYPYTSSTLPSGAYSFEPDILNVTVTQIDKDGNVTTGTKDGVVTNVNFNMEYELPENVLKSSNYIYYQLPDNIEIPDTGLPADGSLGDVTYNVDGNSLKVGKYRIEKDGLIVIYFFKDDSDSGDNEVYERNVNGQTVNGCHLEFNASVSRDADNNSDEQEIKIGTNASTNSTVTITGFNSGALTVAKSASVATDTNGNRAITWTIDVSNPYSYDVDLTNMVLVDSMLGESGTELTAASKAYGNVSKDTFTFTSGTKIGANSTISVSYTTPITADQNLTTYTQSKDNSVTLGKNTKDSNNNTTVTKYKTAKTTATIPPTFGLSKSASADRTDPDNPVITWTITLTNSEGANLNGYYITDDKLSSATDLTVSGTNAYIQSQSGNKITFGDTGNDAEKVTITYTTQESKASLEASGGTKYENTAKLENPNSSKNITAYAAVSSASFSVNKTGQINQQAGTITWTIKINDDNFASSMIGADLTDTLMQYAIGGDVTVVGYDENWQKQTVSLENNKLTSDCKSLRYVEITYTTDAKDMTYVKDNGDGTYTSTNVVDVDDGKQRDEATKEITYDTQEVKVSKETTGAALSSDNNSLIVGWTVTIEGGEGAFTNRDITDVLSAALNGSDVSNTITAEQLKGITYQVRTGTTSSEYSESKSIDGSGITVSDSDSTGFTLKVNLDKSVSGLKISYKSTVDVSNADAGDIVTYSNKATTGKYSGDGSGKYRVPGDDSLVKCAYGENTVGGNTTVSTDDLEKITINGKQCYLFRWKVKINEDGSYDEAIKNGTLTLTDTLPEGFTLYSTVSKTTTWSSKPNLCYWASGDIWNCTELSQNEKASEYDWNYYTLSTDSKTGQQIVTFNKIGNDGSYSYNDKGYLILTYAAYIPVDELDAKLDTGSDYDVTNTISDGKTTVKQTQTVESTVQTNPDGSKVVSKAKASTSNRYSGGSIDYTIDVNPKSSDLSPTGDTVTLTDIFKFDTDSYTTYDKQTGTETTVNGDGSQLLDVSLDSIKFYKVTYDSNGDEVETEITSGVSYTFDDDPITTEIDTPTVSTPTDEELTAYGITRNDKEDKYFKIDGISAGQEISIDLDLGSTTFSVGHLKLYYNSGVESSLLSGDYSGTVTVTDTVKGGCGSYAILDLKSYWNTLDWANYNPTATATLTTTTDDGDARLIMTIPDNTYVRIKYTYNSNSDTVYKIGASNSVTAVAGNSITKDVENVTYQAMNTSSAYVSNREVTVKKVDSGDTAVLLSAGFKLAKYDSTNKKWVYAKAFTSAGSGSTALTVADSDWVDYKASGKEVSTSSTDAYALAFKPTEGVLYALIETTRPTDSGYANTALQTVYFSLKTKPADDSLPDKTIDGNRDFSSSDIQLCNSGSTLTVENAKQINVSVEKVWVDNNVDHSKDSITVELYSSTTKTADGSIPSGATLVENSQKTISESTNWKEDWDDLTLYNGNDEGKTLYYYVKEVSSTVSDYTVSYSNNGVSSPDNSNNIITITNSKGLTIEKSWVDESGASTTTTETSISVTLYRSTTNGVGVTMPDNKEKVGNYTLTSENNWSLTIENLATKDDSGNTYYYYIEETAVDGWTAEYTVTGVTSNGVIKLKNIGGTTPVSVSLPDTGGIGTAPIVAAGAAVATASAALLICKRRKRKEK